MLLLYMYVAEDNNTRVLFEKAVSSVPSDKARLVNALRIVLNYYFCITHVHVHVLSLRITIYFWDIPSLL